MIKTNRVFYESEKIPIINVIFPKLAPNKDHISKSLKRKYILVLNSTVKNWYSKIKHILQLSLSNLLSRILFL